MQVEQSCLGGHFEIKVVDVHITLIMHIVLVEEPLSGVDPCCFSTRDR